MSKKAAQRTLKPREAAAKLSVHVCTVYGMLKSGRLKGFKLRSHWRILESELGAFMEQHNNGRKEQQQ